VRVRWRRLVCSVVGFFFLASPLALAEYRGSDVLGNIGPESQVAGGLADRYPLSAYTLDYHVDVGVTNPDGIPPMIAQWAAAQLWNITSFLVKSVIDLFTWAFSLDLLNGSDGALAPVSQAISSLYTNVIGQEWMIAAILIAGVWGIWKALMQRRYTETIGAFAVSITFVLIALFFVYRPAQTIGQASKWTNQLSLAFLSGTTQGSLDDPQGAKRQVADQLFDTLVYKPWVVLEFGGLSHCVDTGKRDSDGFPTPVGPHDPARDVCRNHLRANADGFGGYAPRFLNQAPGSDERDAEYDALKKGELPPVAGKQFNGYHVDKSDAPAVDIQQAGGAYQRLTVTIVIFAGALGAVCLLGFLSLAVIMAQVVALVLLGFAPIALIVGIFPGAGHAVFRGWLSKLATAIFIKALYSLTIAIVVAVAAALTGATASLGFLFAFALEAIFFWAIFLYRKQITARLVSATGGGDGPSMPRMTVAQRAGAAAAAPFGALVGVSRRDRGEERESKQQESALGGPVTTTSEPASNGAGSVNGAPPVRTEPHVHVHANGDGADGGARRNGSAGSDGGSSEERFVKAGSAGSDEPSSGEQAGRLIRVPRRSGATASDEPSASEPRGRFVRAFRRSGTATVEAPAHEYSPSAPAAHGDSTPRVSHDDVMRRARELRERDGHSEEERDA
jgi:hypothetical protein